MPNTNYNIILSAFTDVSIFQWSLTENGATIAGSGFTFGSQFNQTYSFNRLVGSYTYLFSFRGVGGAHGWPAYTTVSITVDVQLPALGFILTAEDGTNTVKGNPGDIVTLVLKGEPDGYNWGAVQVDFTQGVEQVISVEEDYRNWWDGMGLWWTLESSYPSNGGGGIPYYYDHDHTDINARIGPFTYDDYLTEGTVDAASWEAESLKYWGGAPLGPSASIDGATIRFYYSGYLGSDKPGIKITVKLNSAAPIEATISNHTRTEFTWSAWENINDATVYVTPRVNYQAVHNEDYDANIWVGYKGPETAAIGETINFTTYGQLLLGSGQLWYEVNLIESNGTVTSVISGTALDRFQGTTATVKPGLNTIQVLARDIDREHGNGTDVFVEAYINKGQPPAAPTNLIATAVSSSQINLTWQHNAINAKEYVVERKDNYSNYAPIAWVSLLSDSETPGINVNFSDTGLTQDTNYSYRVQCYNEVGHSDYSNEANASTWLEAPSNMTANSASISQVDIGWTNNAPAAEGFTIERMNVYRKFIPIATVGSWVTSYSDTGLEQNTRYNYRVQAFRTGNTSDYSQEGYGDTLPLTTNYIMDSLSHYYQNGQINNYGIYNSLVSKLQSAQDAMIQGNWSAYQNKMQAVINELEAQAGKGVEHQAAEKLSHETKSTKEQKPEIKGADGKSKPAPFLPVCFPVSFTIILPPINGSWSVTATDGAGVNIQGGSGTITPSGPVTRTITVHATQPSASINIVVTVTPDRGAPITGTLTAPIPAIPTDFLKAFVYPFPVNIIQPPTKITPTATGGIIIAGPSLNITAKAKISTDDIGAAYVDTWVLGYLQNVISSTRRFVYSPPTTTLVQQLNPAYLPALDHFGPGVPMTGTNIIRPFSTNGQTQSASTNDTPTAKNIPIQIGTATLSEFYSETTFITWFIAKNTTTGEIRYLYWWRWTQIQHITYNSETREATKLGDTGIFPVPPAKDEGFGNGTDATGVTPNIKIPLANNIGNDRTKYPDGWITK
ncbi:MAG TPA: fibronectin type III domain-containing protein [Planctomycetota bacterium]|nr:fibronectin type III domain-containing protein [Planctomycetota bacterium]